jgi:hypothetical protein
MICCKPALDGPGSPKGTLAQKRRFRNRCKPMKTQGNLLGFEAPQKHMIVGEHAGRSGDIVWFNIVAAVLQ